MPKQKSCFIPFKHNIDHFNLPKKFTFPFFYTPHPLCVLAAEELQQYLSAQHEINNRVNIKNSTVQHKGKMFGVLVVKNAQQEIGYLTAFSGQLEGKYNLGKFVPSIPNSTNSASFDKTFLLEQTTINELTKQLLILENSPELSALKNKHAELILGFKQELSQYQTLMANNRKRRKKQRHDAQYPTKKTFSNEALNILLNTLAKESVHDKNQYKRLKTLWQTKIDNIQTQINMLNQRITLIKEERHARSSLLQNTLFQQYQLLNSLGEKKPLQDIFKPTAQEVPPSGAGDCAAPKLIQYAFKNNFKIIAMAEFWWGESPKSEIRKHKSYYPACAGKCEPILNWMLTGVELDENPLLINTAQHKPLEILYQDDVMAVVNKPNELLSVPGKHIKDSVYSRIKALIPKASGPIIVHRLDMCTSGLMIIALTKKAHQHLQKQFIQRKVEKRYVALLNGAIKNTSGEITLPLREDFLNRPRQLVCFENGKPAHTKWRVIHRSPNNQTTLHLFPKTGRTHQLRVHCAHNLGLNTPIVGDDLYGDSANRLYLHAEKITLLHPVTQAEITFQTPAKF